MSVKDVGIRVRPEAIRAIAATIESSIKRFTMTPLTEGEEVGGRSLEAFIALSLVAERRLVAMSPDVAEEIRHIVEREVALMLVGADFAQVPEGRAS